MTVTDFSFDRLLAAGYLPEVLPPCFRSDSFGSAFAKNKSYPPEFNHADKDVIPKSSKCTKYTQAQPGGQRRVFSIPNPVHYFRLAKCFYDNKDIILCKACESSYSITKPKISSGIKCFSPDVSYRDRPFRRASVRATSRYVLRCDIARFFPSVYTHMIAWAIEGKPIAKAKQKDKTLLGNKLDACFRALQDNQTIGIPIGQDISRVIAEVILASVESLAKMKVKKWPEYGIRCIDDYEIGFLDVGMMDEFLSAIHAALGEYELALNPLKTKKIALPQPLLDRWDSELRRFSFTGSHHISQEDDSESDDLVDNTAIVVKPNISELLIFINRAIELQRECPDEAVLRYSLKRMANLSMTDECWPLYQDYMLHCALNRSETMRLVVSNMFKAVFVDCMKLDSKRFGEVINEIISHGASSGCSSDLSWALWAALVFKTKINAINTKLLGEIEDPVVCCLACEAHSRKLLRNNFNSKLLMSIISDSSSFYDERWLIAYEAYRNGWVKADESRLDVCFSYLIKNDVKFFIDDQPDQMRKQLKKLRKTSKNRGKIRKSSKEDDPDGNDDSSGTEDLFDEWWFKDDD